MFKHRKKDIALKWVLQMVAIFFIIISLTLLAILFFEKKYQNKIYPGIYIGNIDLSGKTKNQAITILNREINKINQNGIIFKYKNTKKILMPVISSMGGDLAYNIIDFDAETTVNKAFSQGREFDFFKNFKIKYNNAFNGKQIKMQFLLNKEKAIESLKNSFKELETKPNDAFLVFKSPGKYRRISAKNFFIEKEKSGEVINYEKGIAEMQENLSNMLNVPIYLYSTKKEPKIHKKDCANIDNQINKILKITPITLKHKNKKFVINAYKLAPFLSLKQKNRDIFVGLNIDLFAKYLEENISPQINIEPTNAKFEVKDGKVVEFQESKDGLKLNTIASAEKLERELLKENNEIDLITKALKSDIQMKQINDFGIKEIIGTGHSNFAYSPKNRRHNIAVGASSVNGVLIEPGEEFSLIKTLGEINKESGYLPELVIKEGKTIPEYGGGLCQIGTTVFRAALASGLPITMRRNHSYRVSYYEPAGTDATIYDPWPDLKFINDTGHYILIQSRIEGDDLYFDFWGTKDGRIASTTYPVIYNIVKPGPTKFIETDTLKPGEKKCTEHAHNGADAYFDYTVKYPNGEIKEKRFKSHYVPWREVCLIGVEKNASSTTENISQ